MLEKNGFFAAPNLDDEESIIRPNKKAGSDEHTGSNTGQKKTSSSFFVLRDLDGNPMGVQPGRDTSEKLEGVQKGFGTIRRKPGKEKKTSLAGCF